MKAARRLLDSPRVREFVCWLMAKYIRLVRRSGTWPAEGAAIPTDFWNRGEPFILAFWHGRLLMMPCAWRADRPINMLISQHRDGELIARTVAHFGIDTVRGSPKRGGAAALRAMLKALAGGQCIGITPDGPRGPRMRASDGIVTVARLSGAAIIPAAYSARRRIVLGSWDRFMVPLPFAGGAYVWGQPIRVPRDADEATIEEARRHIENSLNAVTDEADRLCGQPTIAPAPAPASVTSPAEAP